MKRYFSLVLLCSILYLPLWAGAQETIPVPDTLKTDSTEIVIVVPANDTLAADTIIARPVGGPVYGVTQNYKPSTPGTRVVYPREIAATPNANIISILSATNGVVNGNGSLYFRGSRSDEIAYFIDGFNVTEQYTGEIATPINLAAIEELSVTTGGWGVETGDAMGGVVNFKTKEYSDKFNIFGKWTTEPSRNGNKFETALGGALPFYKNISYLLSAETDNGDDIRPCFMPEKFYVPDPSKDYLWVDTLRYSYSTWDSISLGWTGGWEDSTDGAWQAEKAQRIADGWVRGWKESDAEYLPHSDYNKYRITGKASYKIQPLDAKLSLLGIATRDQEARYNASWKYNLDGYYSKLQKSHLLGATWTHSIANKINYTLKLSKHHSQTQSGIRDTIAEKTRSWWEDYTFLSDTDADGDSMYDAYEGQAYSSNDVDNPYGVDGIFYTTGLARVWEKSFSDYASGKLDVSSRINEYNRLSGGVEFKKYRVYKKYNSLPWEPLASYYSPVGVFVQSYDFKPETRAIYIQEHFIYDKIAINAGLRFNHVNLGDSFNYTNFFWLTDSTPLYEKRKSTASLGTNITYLLFPSTHVECGFNQYYQIPAWDDFYKKIHLSLYSVNTLADYQKTTLYETGITHQINTNTAVNANFYYKNINNILQSREMLDSTTGLNYIYYYYYGDYGTVKGFELNLDHKTDYFIGQFNYSYSKALSAIKDNDSNNIVMNYNQSGKFKLVTNFYSGDNFGPKVANFHPLANITLGLTNNLGTGFPYTHKDLKGNTIGNLNDSLLPSYWYTDLLISKKMNFNKVNLSLDLEILNLFDRKNVSGLYSVTGEVNYDGKFFDLSEFIALGNTPDSISYTVDGNGLPVMVPNPYYSKWRDLNSDGTIDPYENYNSYITAWNDYISDPFNPYRVPYSSAYLAPRRFKLALSVSF
ncbi:MAG: TonB-dependent receptor plug domain-containing protein [Candidatus Edwardsbacteria bacterium]|nr:TonB-dependent receptor plug domain-containing protein [Candidatus Edwardsbacteria bacterium]